MRKPIHTSSVLVDRAELDKMQKALQDPHQLKQNHKVLQAKYSELLVQRQLSHVLISDQQKILHYYAHTPLLKRLWDYIFDKHPMYRSETENP